MSADTKDLIMRADKIAWQWAHNAADKRGLIRLGDNMVPLLLRELALAHARIEALQEDVAELTRGEP